MEVCLFLRICKVNLLFCFKNFFKYEENTKQKRNVCKLPSHDLNFFIRSSRFFSSLYLCNTHSAAARLHRVLDILHERTRLSTLK